MALLKQGITNSAEVEELQQWLADRGYYTGAINGDFTAKVTSAVKAFQKDAGISVDGVVGSQTRAAMDQDPDGGTSTSGGSTDALNNVPGGGELWKVGSTYMLVYETPGVSGQKPVQMGWKVSKGEELEALFGGKNVKTTRNITWDQWKKLGGLNMGIRAEITNESEHPFAVLVERYNQEAEIRPWLKDPEIFALHAAATLEGRAMTEAELKTTDWWQTHNEAEREWLRLNASDPATAAKVLADNRAKIRDRLIAEGYDNPDGEIIRILADGMTRGTFTERQVADQIRAVVDPWSGIKLHNSLKGLVEAGHAQTRAGEDRARELFSHWLGGLVDPPDETIRGWAGRLRNDPDAEMELIDNLRRRRKALLPEYDEDLAWADIAPTWQQMMSNTWGTMVDDSDPLLHKIIRMNDAEEAGKVLRTEGLKRDVTKVTQDAQRDMTQVFGEVL